MSRPVLAPTEQTIVDLFRVALTGDDAGMRQLCRRVIRRPPSDSEHPRVFSAALGEVLASAPTPVGPSPLRSPKTDTTSVSEPTWNNRGAEATDVGRRSTPTHAPRPQLDDPTAAVLDDLIAEHRNPAALESFGLAPTRAALFTGPPGVGKTMSATYVASSLQLPLITVDIASLMSSYLGRTGRNLQSVVEQALQQPSVLLLDEFDAIARSRREDADVGEVRRIVTVLLQQLDRLPVGGVLIAATNHAEALDDAVLRRFDRILEFSLPGFDARRAAIAASQVVQAAAFPNGLIDHIALATTGWSHSDVRRWVSQTARAALLHDVANAGADAIRTATASSALQLLLAQSEASIEFRTAVAKLGHYELGLPHRDIAPLLGVTHVTVGNYLRKEKDRNKSIEGDRK